MDHSCDIVMTVGPERLPTGSLGTSNEHLDDRRPDGQTSSRKLCAEGTRRYVSLEPETFTGLLWLATGMNGDVAGARSRLSMNNGTTGDTGDTGFQIITTLLFRYS
ncbi:hypothetical protein GCK32_007616 [Trichostrongylus colubriformis]|uniref:Uncharacterized protein n=1 Tax=Trichostrongylus colubriformis TaxID=6319 RepID=A0AAN8G8B9_TRICO